MSLAAKTKKGFSLIEVAIVLVIIAIVFSSVVIPQGERVYRQKKEATAELLLGLQDTLLFYYLAHGRFPCPALPTTSGEEGLDSDQVACISNHGFFPVRTLKMTGKTNEDGLLIDWWNNPIRYSVSDRDRNQNRLWDWTTTDDVLSTTLSQIVGNLKICDKADCSDLVLSDDAVFALLATNKYNYNSLVETKNLGEVATLGSLRSYLIKSDNVFVHLEAEQMNLGNAYDDTLLWTAPIQTYRYIIQRRTAVP